MVNKNDQYVRCTGCSSLAAVCTLPLPMFQSRNLAAVQLMTNQTWQRGESNATMPWQRQINQWSLRLGGCHELEAEEARTAVGGHPVTACDLRLAAALLLRTFPRTAVISRASSRYAFILRLFAGSCACSRPIVHSCSCFFSSWSQRQRAILFSV